MPSKYGFEPPAPTPEDPNLVLQNELFIEWEKHIKVIEPIVDDILEDFGKSQLFNSCHAKLNSLCKEGYGWGDDDGPYNEARWELYSENYSKVSVLFRQKLPRKQTRLGVQWHLVTTLIGQQPIKIGAIKNLQQVLCRELNHISCGRFFVGSLQMAELKCH